MESGFDLNEYSRIQLRLIRVILPRQLLFQHVIQLRRISLAFAGLHGKSDEEAEQLVFA